MPVVSSKINQQELDVVAEYANRHGITISNLIRMLLIREVASPRVLASRAANANDMEEAVNKENGESPKRKTLLERIRENSRVNR
jgi:antitoxin component of RelBE/YafQ-DinJ toxin-antitoxin module